MTLSSSRPASLQEVMEHHIQFTENGIAIFDPDDFFIFHNRAFVNIFGLDPAAMAGWGLDDWLTWMYVHRGGVNIEWDSLEAWLGYVHGVSRSKPFRRFETDLIDGRWLLVSEQSYPSGHLVLHCADITLQKKTEKDLKEAIAKIEHIAQTDELTNLPNRRHILGRFHEELLRAARYKHDFCFGILDIDHFKRVNDTYGHPVGDQVLRHFSAFLRDRLRSQDIVGRLGGEEFAVLFPETKVDDAMLVLSRINEALHQECLAQIAPDFSYSFSAGVVSTQADLMQDCTLLMAKADKALYQAKNGGRNQVLRYRDDA
ncbi:diguanylate cyclase (GGDEF) domain-containing protein [Herbaspirillum sp. CF444]|uniref:GGDEF domain-containing protein n=1 Tax=Herbaspirillum sp. CF444 TaxID=1144319 RepID=UPI0002725274|nr:sensor domain-containing diguanylate cyclase [Herbaspirillum sp. CF444]EJL80848.1 diguanylate cyclase (GGDEF) domain-containing protein [Herbaspirillum sp. CF444]